MVKFFPKGEKSLLVIGAAIIFRGQRVVRETVTVGCLLKLSVLFSNGSAVSGRVGRGSVPGETRVGARLQSQVSARSSSGGRKANTSFKPDRSESGKFLWKVLAAGLKAEEP